MVAIKSQHSFTFSYNFIYHHIIQNNEQGVSAMWLFKLLYLASIKNPYSNISHYSREAHTRVSHKQKYNRVHEQFKLPYCPQWLDLKLLKAGPSSAIAADMKVVLHCSWQMFYIFISIKDSFLLPLLNLRSYLQLLFSVHGHIDSFQFIFWNSEDKYFQISSAVHWKHTGLRMNLKPLLCVCF